MSGPGRARPGDGRRDDERMPRWVKVSLIVAASLIVVFVLAQLVGGGNHGPRRHLPTRVEPTPTAPGGRAPAPGAGNLDNP